MRVFWGFACGLALSAAVPVSFERDVQPILADAEALRDSMLSGLTGGAFTDSSCAAG